MENEKFKAVLIAIGTIVALVAQLIIGSYVVAINIIFCKSLSEKLTKSRFSRPHFDNYYIYFIMAIILLSVPFVTYLITPELSKMIMLIALMGTGIFIVSRVLLVSMAATGFIFFAGLDEISPLDIIESETGVVFKNRFFGFLLISILWGILICAHIISFGFLIFGLTIFIKNKVRKGKAVQSVRMQEK